MPTLAKTVAEYLQQLDPDRRAVISTVRDAIRKKLPKGYTEQLGWGGIVYCIPLEDYPDTYNKLPLAPFALVAQKNYNSLHAMCLYGDEAGTEWLREEFTKAGKRLDMGKGCIRFKQADDLALGAIEKLVAKTTPKRFIAMVEQAREQRKAAKSK